MNPTLIKTEDPVKEAVPFWHSQKINYSKKFQFKPLALFKQEAPKEEAVPFWHSQKINDSKKFQFNPLALFKKEAPELETIKQTQKLNGSAGLPFKQFDLFKKEEPERDLEIKDSNIWIFWCSDNGFNKLGFLKKKIEAFKRKIDKTNNNLMMCMDLTKVGSRRHYPTKALNYALKGISKGS